MTENNSSLNIEIDKSNENKGEMCVVHIIIICSIILGVLGIIMTLFSLYLIKFNAKLVKTINEKECILIKQKEKIEEKNKVVKERDGFILILREEIGIRDRTINQLKRKN